MSISMDMPMSTGSSNDTEMVMMTPWLHFVGGDSLFFKTLHPSSHGAIAAACIVLGLLAILERWISSTRGILEGRWAHSAQAVITKAVVVEEPLPDKSSKDPNFEVDVNSLKDAPGDKGRSIRSLRVSRSSPPFIFSHDVPRGVVFAFQALLAYVLMLAVMTFQAAYIISIIVGLGLGEILFGRFAGGRSGHILH